MASKMDSDSGEYSGQPGPRPLAETIISKVERCDSCRLTGTIGCAGFGVYMLSELRKAKTLGHRASTLGLAGVFFSLSYYRWHSDD